MTVGHCVTETKNNFDGVTHSSKYTEKDYHRARGYVLSPHDLLVETLSGRAFEFFSRCSRKYRQRTKPRQRRLVQFAREGLGLLCDRRNNFSFVLFHNKQ